MHTWDPSPIANPLCFSMLHSASILRVDRPLLERTSQGCQQAFAFETAQASTKAPDAALRALQLVQHHTLVIYTSLYQQRLVSTCDLALPPSARHETISYSRATDRQRRPEE